MYSIRNQIWEILNETERRVRYYRKCRRRYDKRYKWSRALMLLFSMSGMASFLEILPIYVGIAVSLGLSIVVVLDYTLRYGEKSATFAILEKELLRIREQSKQLWSDRNSAKDEITERHRSISEQILHLDSSDLVSMLPESKELAIESEKEADNYMETYTYA